jgi:hypothetical protein
VAQSYDSANGNIDERKEDKDMLSEKNMNRLRVGLLALTAAAAAASAAGTKNTVYASGSSCSADCDCPGGTVQCCTLANGATCYKGQTIIIINPEAQAQ